MYIWRLEALLCGLLENDSEKGEGSPSYIVALLALRLMSDRSEWPRGLRRRTAASRLLGLRVRIPLGAWMFISRECCELLHRSLLSGGVLSNFVSKSKLVLSRNLKEDACSHGGCRAIKTYLRNSLWLGLWSDLVIIQSKSLDKVLIMNWINPVHVVYRGYYISAKNRNTIIPSKIAKRTLKSDLIQLLYFAFQSYTRIIPKAMSVVLMLDI